MTTPETQTPVATKKVTAVKKAPMVAKKVAVAKKAPAAKKAPVARKLAPQSVVQTAAPAKPGKKKDKVKDAKIKIVRDSFTMPEADFALIDRIKLRAIEWRHPVKKSEVLRAALQALNALPDARVKALLSGLADIKKGRPRKTGG